MRNIQSIPRSDDILRTVLPNQIVLLARENSLSPSVVISGYLPGGSVLDPVDRSGLAIFLSLALMRGTETNSFEQIFRKLEDNGASLGFNAGFHSFSFAGQSLAEDLPTMLDLLSDILRSPIFPENHLTQIRDQILTTLAIRSQDTAEMASIAFDQALFGSHPYGRDKLGTPESVQSVTQSALIRHHAQYFKPQGMVISIVGGIEPEKAADLVRKYFTDWEASPQAIPNLPDFPKVTKPEKGSATHIEIPEKSQLDLVIGSIAPERKSPQYQPARLGNCILGEFGMMGRIGRVVRDENGLAYYAGSDVNCLPLGGSWEISAGINPENLDRTIDLIRSEIRKFVSTPVEPNELSDVQSYYLGRMPLQLESNTGIANELLSIERYQLGLDYLRQYSDIIRAVTREQILETAATYLDPDRLTLATAGTLRGKA